MKNIIVFPSLSTSLGGVKRVEYNRRTATIYSASGAITVVARKSLPPVEQWTAFNLADRLSELTGCAL